MYRQTTSFLLTLTLAAILSTFVLTQTTSANFKPSPFYDGTHIVGEDIAPATYVAEFNENICYVHITSKAQPERKPTFIGRAIITITDQDTQVDTSGCGEWIPRSETPATKIEKHFGQGTFQVGIDIAPGIYTADNNNGRCLWFTLTDFTYKSNTEQRLNWWKIGKPVVQLTQNDVAIYSIRCGTWHIRESPKPQQIMTQFSDGSHLVGIDIAPGTYTTNSKDQDCRWFRTATFAATTPDNSGGYVSNGQQIATILPSDNGFFSQGCGTWKPFATTEKLHKPANNILQGTYAVGINIQPGTYIADTIPDRICRWFLLSGFAGREADIISSGNGILRGIAQIPPNVVGFRSVDCQQWSQIENIEPSISETFGDGEHIVNLHIKPGIYTSPGSNTRCSWRRLIRFTGSSADHVAVRNPVGRNIAEITQKDAIFKSFGCGTWKLLDKDTQSKSTSTFQHGTWIVNAEIPPGTYTAQAIEGATCFWSRLSAFTGEPIDFEATNNSHGHSVMTIHQFDVGFYSDGCGIWTPITPVTPESSKLDIQHKNKFQDGVYIVKHNIAPGTYIANGIDGEICSWSRLKGFDGDIFNHINSYYSAGQAIATILETDVGFKSIGCGTWHQLQNVEPNDPNGKHTHHELDQSIKSSFSDGTYQIGIDILPGTYIASDSTNTTCRWRRLRDFTWNTGTIHENIASGIKIVTLNRDDVGFASFGCGKWMLLEQQNTPKPETPPTRFGNGSYIVGLHIEPGTYYSLPSKGSRCRWRRVTGFSGAPDQTISSGQDDTRWVVKIDPSDIGFITHGCGTWRNVETALEITPSSQFQDGVFRIGRDVLPGNYTATVPTKPFINGKPVPNCRWRTLSGFSHTEHETIADGNGKGKIEVTLTSDDVGFVSRGCGKWIPNMQQ